MNINDAERWAEYQSEQAAAEQESFECFCEANDIHPDTEEAIVAWQVEKENIRREEEQAAHEDRLVEEYQWRLRDLEEERSFLYE